MEKSASKAVGDAGIVFYERKGHTFEGCWTHADVKGVRGREVVHDVDEGSLEGDWPVDIYLPNHDEPYYQGRLRSERIGESLMLSWTGNLTSSGTRMDFKGIGLELGSDLIVASFQEMSQGAGSE